MERVSTERFYRSHLTNPKGRGGWMFENKEGQVVFTHCGTYAEAKKAAVSFSKKKDVFLYVCP